MAARHPIRPVRFHGPPAEAFRSSFVNLAAGSPLAWAAPMDPPLHAVATTGEAFTAWDFVEVR